MLSKLLGSIGAASPLFLAAIMLFGALTRGFAADMQVITLKDQSVIRGEVLELIKGVYRVKTPTMGEVHIPADQVLVIAAESAMAPRILDGRPRHIRTPREPAHRTGPEAALNEQQHLINQKVQGLAGSADVLESLMEFSQNPDLQAVMNDPELMEAIQSGHYEALMAHPAIQQLMNHPQTQEILGIFQP